MITKQDIKSIVKEYTEEKDMYPIREIGDGYSDSIKKELEARLDQEKEESFRDIDLDSIPETDPSKEYVAPSKKVISNVCKREGICNEQGPITFGQLERLIKTAQKKKIATDVGEGVFKSLIRLLPWFIPQIAIGAFVGSGMRSVNKIIKPALETTKGYKSWWGQTILTVMNYAEGELPTSDPLSKVFFISDGLLELMSKEHKIKFARYVAEVASNKPDNEAVPEYFVENLLRDWINQKFLLNPPLQPKQLNEGFKEVVLTLGLLLGGNMAVSQTNADKLLSEPKIDTVETIDTILKDQSLFNDYLNNVKKLGIIDKPNLEFVDDWVRYKGMEFQIKPPMLNRGKLLVGVRFPIN